MNLFWKCAGRDVNDEKVCSAFITPAPGLEFYRGPIAVEGEQNAVDHCGNDGNFLLYSAINFLYYIHCALLFWYLNSDVDQIMHKSLF